MRKVNLAMFLGLVLGIVSAVNAATYIVNRTDDRNTLVCMPGDCSLREAVAAANASAENDVINFDPVVFSTFPKTILLTGRHLPVAANGSLTINGPGPDKLTISAQLLSRIFYVSAGATASFNGMTITQGKAPFIPTYSYYNSCQPVREDCEPIGGGILNYGTASIDNAVITENYAELGASPFARGGSIANMGGRLTVTNSKLLNSRAREGAAILNDNQSTLTVKNSLFSGNYVDDGNGSAIFNNQESHALIVGSTFSGNTGNTIANLGRKLVIINSTVTDNRASSVNTSFGAGTSYIGIHTNGLVGFAETNIINCTITRNYAIRYAAGVSSSESVRQGTLITIANSIVAGNTAGVGAPDLRYRITSLGHNIFGNTTGATITGDVASDITNVNPRLGALEYNGGLTPTIAPLIGSPAINAGDDSLAVDEFGQPLTTDQRGAGFSRIADGRIDIGAFEGVGLPANLIVDDLGDSGSPNFAACQPQVPADCSLRGAISKVLSNYGEGVVTFDRAIFSVSRTISLSSELPVADGTVVINGPGADRLTITGNGTRLFNAANANLTINAVTLANGTNNGGNGGAILATGGSLSLQNTAVRGSRAANGGGVYCDACRLNFIGATFSGNTVTARGGGFYLNAVSGILANVTVSGNTAAGNGGGIYMASGDLRLVNSTLTNNTANTGGGTAVAGGTMRIANTIISANHANPAPDIQGIISSEGCNLVTDLTGATVNNQKACDKFNVAAGLGPLTSNGGALLTHRLLPGSPAIDAGDDGFAQVQTNEALVNDGRGPGFPRFDGARVDLGAYETIIAGASFTVDNFNDSAAAGACTDAPNDCSLRGAMKRAAQSPGDDTITFDPSLYGQIITLTDGWNDGADISSLRVRDKLTIIGPPNGAGITVEMQHGLRKRHITVESEGSLSVSNLSFTNGSVTSEAGGSIQNDGELSVSNCTFNGNAALRSGAIESTGFSSLNIENSTFANNSAVSSSAINSDANQLTLKNVTISGNSATATTGAALTVRQSSATMINTIVAANAGGDVALEGGGSFSANSANNLIGTGGSGNLTNGSNGNKVGVADAGLLPLSAYGGSTSTFALQPNSPAVNGGTSNNVPSLDQRGRSRFGAADIGAFEAPGNLIVTNTLNAGAGSLRNAIANANANVADDTISFAIPANDSGCTGGVCTIPVTGGELTINDAGTAGTVIITNSTGAKNLRIAGNGASRVFYTKEGSITAFNGLTITGGSVSGSEKGGGIGNSIGTLTVTNSIITGNYAALGGGIGSSYGQVAVINSTIHGNSALGAGGGISDQYGNKLSVINSTISDNTAGQGGGIYVFTGNAFLTNATITGNGMSNGSGGGIYSQGSVALLNTIVAGNLGSSADIFGNLSSLGYNLIGTSSISGDQTGVIFGGTNNPVNAQLAPLGFNGGQTPTRALMANSPAINAGLSVGQAAFDQRGTRRNLNGAADIGAFEVGVITPTFSKPLFFAPNNTGAALIDLNQTFYPNPAGGTFSAANVSNNFFDPAGQTPGEKTVDYLPNNTSSFDVVNQGAVKLTVFGPPQVTGSPANQTLNLGETASFTAASTGIYSGSAPESISNGAILLPGQFIMSQNRGYQLLYQGDGNLVLYRANGGPIWASNTATNEAGFVAMQGDGNLVIYSNAGQPQFASNTSGNPGARLLVQNDGNLVIYSTADVPIWSSNSAISGTNPITDVQWQVSANGGADYDDISGAQRLTLSVSNVTAADDNKKYRAKFSNAAGAVFSEPATLDVIVPTPLTLVVDTTSDDGNLNACTAAANDCSLRGAIGRANDNAENDTINFDPTFFATARTITLTNGQLTIANNGTLTINGTRADRVNVSGNNASRVFEVSTGANLTLIKMTVSGGREVFGGGINNHGTLALNTVTITGNTATGGGGGINSDTGTVTNISNSAITNNTSASNAGGLYFYYAANVTVFNTTVSGNIAGNYGGGITNEFSTIQMTNATIANNTGAFGGGVYNFDGSTIFARNDLIAGNFAGSAPDFSGTLSAQGFNLIGSTSGATVTGDTTGNLLNVDAKLLPLSNYGGETPTVALLPDSPAINAGTAVNVPDIDQRGRARLGSTDIGAYEAAANLVVTNTANSGAGSLPAAFAAANGSAADESITFAIPSNDSGCVNGVCTINLNGGLDVGAAATSGGLIVSNQTGAANLIISANGQGRAFTSNGGNLAINGVTITGGQVGDNGRGGGIFSSGNLVVSNSTITGNAGGVGGQGGGIYNQGGMLTIANTTISNNTTATGGGSTFGGAIFNDNGPLTITDSTISGNTSGFGGGAICNTGAGAVVNLTNVTISGNSAIRGAGLFNVNNGRINTVNVTIAGNATFDRSGANGDGGGVLSDNGPITIRNTNIAGNTSSNASDVRGPLTSRGYNLIGRLNSLNDPVNGDQTGNMIGTNPSPIDAKLAPLGFYGGKTLTHALLAGSPAINAGTSAGSTLFDQRGAGRIGNIDIGAFELNSTQNGGNYVAQFPRGSVSQSYSQTIVPDTGLTVYCISSGTLPNGLSGIANCAAPLGQRDDNLRDNSVIAAPNAVLTLSGTPTQGGTFNFAISATTGSSTNVTNYTLNILAPTAAGVSISGRVLTANGRGLQNAIVIMTDTNGNTRSSRTASFGYYRFENIGAGQTCIIEVHSKRYTFAPQVVSVSEDLTEVNFTAQ